MLLASSFSVRLALVGATMFSLIGASDSSQSDGGSAPVEKRDSFDHSLQGSVMADENYDLSWIDLNTLSAVGKNLHLS